MTKCIHKIEIDILLQNLRFFKQNEQEFLTQNKRKITLFFNHDLI